MTTQWSTSTAKVQTSEYQAGLAGLKRMYGMETTATIDAPFRWCANVVTFGPIVLVRGALDVFAQLTMVPPRHMIVASYKKSYHIENRRGKIATIPGLSGLVCSVGEPITIQCDPGMHSNNWLIEPQFLEDQLTALTGKTGHAIEFEPNLDMRQSIGLLLHQLGHYVNEHMDRESSTLPPALAASLGETISRALLIDYRHNYSHLLHKPVAASGDRIVHTVEEYMAAHVGQPIVADDLVRLTGVPMNSIDAAFREHRQTTAFAFLRRRRLEHARAMLLEELSLPINQIAHLAGYLRFEVFESAYFKAFKESPTETRRRGLFGLAPSTHTTSHPHLPSPEARISLLSDRERQVCERIVTGLLNKQIADELAITERTVKFHRANAMAKLGVQSTPDLIRLWERLPK